MGYALAFIAGMSVSEAIIIGLCLALGREKTVEMIRTAFHTTKERQPVSIVRTTTDAERAMDAIKQANADRGGIPDNELR